MLCTVLRAAWVSFLGAAAPTRSLLCRADMRRFAAGHSGPPPLGAGQAGTSTCTSQSPLPSPGFSLADLQLPKPPECKLVGTGIAAAKMHAATRRNRFNRLPCAP